MFCKREAVKQIIASAEYASSYRLHVSVVESSRPLYQTCVTRAPLPKSSTCIDNALVSIYFILILKNSASKWPAYYVCEML
jgi:hypothetical protein